MDPIPVEFAVANHHDVTLAGLGLLDPDRVRRVRLRGIMDSRAMRPVLPESVIDQLGLAIVDSPAAPRSTPRAIVKGVSIELLSRAGVYTSFVEPDPTTTIFGLIAMGDLDLVVDRDTRTLQPRDPDGISGEIE